MKKVSLLMICLFAASNLFAQADGSVDMADTLRASGKIYVVIAIIAVIFLGLAIYLFSIDRRLKKLENDK